MPLWIDMDRTEILDRKILNPVTKKRVTVRYALRLAKTHPAYKAAFALVNRGRKAVKKKKVVKKKVQPSFDVDIKALKVVERFTDAVTRRQLETHAEKYLNGVSPVDIAAKYLSLIYDPSKKGNDIQTLSVYVDTWEHYPKIQIEIRLDNGTSITRSIQTSTRNGTNVIHNDYFELGKDVPKGGGLARKMLQETIKIAEAINAKAVLFEAGLTAGGYVWAKYGAIPAPKSRINIYNTVLEKLLDTDRYFTEMIESTERSKEYYSEKLQIAKEDGDSYEIEYYQRFVDRYDSSMAKIKQNYEMVKQNKDVVEKIKKLVTSELKKIGDFDEDNYDDSDYYGHERKRHQMGKMLSPDLLTYIANTPLGKFLLLDTGWNGYFNMKKGSLGRTMLEKAINTEK